MSKEIKYIHLWVVGKKVGRATVAYRRSEDRKGLDFAVTFCSPNDEYTREEGRKRAGSRLQTGPKSFLPYIGTRPGANGLPYICVSPHVASVDWRPAAALLDELNESGQIQLPNWARRAEFVFEPHMGDRIRYRPIHRKGDIEAMRRERCIEPITTTIAEISEPSLGAAPLGGPILPVQDDDNIPF